MAQNYRYIVCLVLPNQTTHRRGCRTHHTHNHHKCASEHHRGSDKPPGKLNPNRNAKFAPFFSRGEFGVFCHAYNIISESACEYARTLNVGCKNIFLLKAEYCSRLAKLVEVRIRGPPILIA